MSTVIHAGRVITGELNLIDAWVRVLDPRSSLDRARASMADATFPSIRTVSV